MVHRSALSNYRPLRSPRLHEGVVRQITTQIVEGILAPGTSLPSETALAQQFKVSRTVIREAVRVLVSKGLVAVKHGSGMQVQPSEQWDLLDPLILFEHLRISQDKAVLSEVLELRLVMEVEVAALAALRHTAEDLHILYEHVAQTRTVLDNPEAYTRLDTTFHELILAAARNRLLAQTLRPVNQALFVPRLISCQRPGGPAISEQGHEAILAAIEKRDQQQARLAMRRHILQFQDDLSLILSQGFADTMADLVLTFHSVR